MCSISLSYIYIYITYMYNVERSNEVIGPMVVPDLGVAKPRDVTKPRDVAKPRDVVAGGTS